MRCIDEHEYSNAVVATFPAFDSTRWAMAGGQAREALDLDTLPSFDESVVLTSDHAMPAAGSRR